MDLEDAQRAIATLARCEEGLRSDPTPQVRAQLIAELEQAAKVLRALVDREMRRALALARVNAQKAIGADQKASEMEVVAMLAAQYRSLHGERSSTRSIARWIAARQGWPVGRVNAYLRQCKART